MFSLSRQGASTAVQTLQYRDRVYRGDKTRCLKIFSAPNYSGLFCNFLLFTVSYRFSKRNNFEAHFWWVTFPMGPERKQFSPVFLLTKTEKICPCFVSEFCMTIVCCGCYSDEKYTNFFRWKIRGPWHVGGYWTLSSTHPCYITVTPVVKSELYLCITTNVAPHYKTHCHKMCSAKTTPVRSRISCKK